RIGFSALAGMVLFLSGCASVREAKRQPADILFPYLLVEDIDKAGLNEPSGICFHTRRGTLFVVGDDGDVVEIGTDGTLLHEKRIRAADFEGITHNPSTGLLYIAIEGEEVIIEINPDTLEILHEFPLPRTLNGKTVLQSGGRGIEGITFVPDSDHQEGGTFYVANQALSLTDEHDLSVVVEVELPLRSDVGEAALIGYFTPEVIDLSGLHYDQATDHLFVTSDATNTIMEYSRQNKLINAWALPGNNQEGITFDSDGFAYIAQDSGGIIKLKGLQ
ncbi:MAG: SdiA-regulated domain-containing protein, partial [Thermodesulfobacteriota bacterium]